MGATLLPAGTGPAGFPGTTLFRIDLAVCSKREALERIVAEVYGKDPGKLHLPKNHRPSHPDFLLSTSQRRPEAVIAISSGPVGVDLEPLSATGHNPSLAAYLTAGETGRSPLEFWTRKEACLKAVGLGLAMPPESVDTSGATVRLCQLTLNLLTVRTADSVISLAHSTPGAVHFFPPALPFLLSWE